MAFTDEQLRILTIVERAASVLSTLGVLTVIVTFCASPHFRNPIHRIILVNALFNVFDVAAIMISLSGPDMGNSSALCQFQGFCLQMFPVADVFFTVAMALDVFLVVFYRYDVEDLHKLEAKYIAVITMFSAIPAITFLFIHTPEKGPMYGSVTLWCSISPNWVLFRIIFYYVIIWFFIFVVMVLYIIIGVEIIKQKKELKATRNDITQTTVYSPTMVSPRQPSNAIAATVEVNARPHSVEIMGLRSRDEWTGASSSKCSIARNSTSDLRVAESVVVDHDIPRRSPVSFGQYILMPLMFFVVLLATWVAPTINRVSSFIDPSFSSYPLLLAVGSMGSLRGFWNGVVFITVGMKKYKRVKKTNKENMSIVRPYLQI